MVRDGGKLSATIAGRKGGNAQMRRDVTPDFGRALNPWGIAFGSWAAFTSNFGRASAP
jgi:hypothetical protein